MFILNLSAQVPSRNFMCVTRFGQEENNKNTLTKRKKHESYSMPQIKNDYRFSTYFLDLFSVSYSCVFSDRLSKEIFVQIKLSQFAILGESSKKSLLCFSIFVKISPHKRFSYTMPWFELTLFNLLIIFGCSVVYFIPLLARGFEQ